MTSIIRVVHGGRFLVLLGLCTLNRVEVIYCITELTVKYSSGQDGAVRLENVNVPLNVCLTIFLCPVY